MPRLTALIHRPGQKPLKIRNVKADFTKNGHRYRKPLDNAEIQVIPSIWGDKSFANYFQGNPRPIPFNGKEWVEEIIVIQPERVQGDKTIPAKTEKRLILKDIPRPLGLTDAEMESHYGPTPARVLREAFEEDPSNLEKIIPYIILVISFLTMLGTLANLWFVYGLRHLLS